MRLSGVFYTLEGRVAEINFRVSARDLPTGAAVQVTDLQLQAGEMSTGVVPNPREAGTREGGAQFRNGVIGGGMDVVVLANLDRTAPVEMTVRGAAGETRIGSYRFGDLDGTATVDGKHHTATHGYGRPLVIPERSDARFPAQVEGRVHLRLTWNDRGP